MDGRGEVGVAVSAAAPLADREPVAVELDAPVVAGELYTITCYAHAVIEWFSPEIAELGVVEGDHEGILVDETAIDIVVGSLDRERSIPPARMRPGRWTAWPARP